MTPSVAVAQLGTLDEALVTPQRTFWATNITKQKNIADRGVPNEIDLAAAVTSIQYNGTIKGTDNVVVSIQDTQHKLLDSGFFDTDDDSKIDPIDINYPEGSRFWWRMTLVSPKADGSISLTFLDRIAVYLMELYGPIKMNRAQHTRAEFLKSLADHVKAAGGIEFYSEQLTLEQPVASVKQTGSTTTAASTKSSNKQTGRGQGAKSAGVGANSKGLTIQGKPLSSSQIAVVNLIVQGWSGLNPPLEACIGCMYAAMGESGLNASASAGVFQTTGTPSAYNGGTDTAGQSKGFMTGGTSFGSPGGIAAAKRGDPAWMIANETEVNAVWIASKGDSYAHQWPGGQAQAIAEATAIVQAAGGGALAGGSSAAGGSTTTVQAYNFEINPKEQYWIGMARLASEVNWELFTDGNRMYYDHDMTLIKQKPAAQIHRDDAAVVDWYYDWDARHICTQMTLVLICEEFEFRPGEVFVLDGFGTASTGSTAKLPGRWLISDFQRNDGDVTTSFTLVQPTKPKMEPAPQIKTVTHGGAAGIGAISGTVRQKIVQVAQQALQLQKSSNYTYYFYTEQYDRIAAVKIGLFGTHHPIKLDCSGFSTLCYKEAGAPDPSGLNFGYLGTTVSMILTGTTVNLAHAQPGDLVFYAGHVAVYLGNNQICNMGSAHGAPGGLSEPIVESVTAPGSIIEIRSYL